MADLFYETKKMVIYLLNKGDKLKGIHKDNKIITYIIEKTGDIFMVHKHENNTPIGKALFTEKQLYDFLDILDVFNIERLYIHKENVNNVIYLEDRRKKA
jgi:hypothetical protein